MRILLVSLHSPFPSSRIEKYGGAELALRTIGKKLALRGHEVHYLTAFRGEPALTERDDIQLHRLRLAHIPFLHRYFNPIKSFNRELRIALIEAAIRRVIPRHRIELIHFYAPYPDGYCCTRTGGVFRIPTVQRLGGKSWERLSWFPLSVRKRILQTYQQTDYFLANCGYLEEEFVRFHENIFSPNTRIKEKIKVVDIGAEIKRKKMW